MNILLGRLQLLVAYPFLHDRRVSSPPIQGMGNVAMSEGVNRYIVLASEALYPPTNMISDLIPPPRGEVEPKNVVGAPLVELSQDGL